jgi:hypothetical protein
LALPDTAGDVKFSEEPTSLSTADATSYPHGSGIRLTALSQVVRNHVLDRGVKQDVALQFSAACQKVRRITLRTTNKCGVLEGNRRPGNHQIQIVAMRALASRERGQ